jgi:hypothetical protein
MPDRTDRRTPDELAFAYATGSRKDVYVEGAEDRNLLIAFLMKHNLATRCAVYEIDEVDIADGVLVTAGLDKGQRSRVLWFARYAASISATSHTQIYCVADRDQDCVIGACHPAKTMHFTDYGCIESYVACDEGLDAIVVSGYQRVSVDRGKFHLAMHRCMTALFIIRGVLHRLRKGLQAVEINGHLRHTPGGPQLLLRSYVDAVLHKNGIWNERSTFYRELRRCYRLIRKLDRRHTMNGHDMVQLLSLWLSNTPPRDPKYATHQDSVRVTLRTAMAGLPLLDYALFKGLVDFIEHW